MKHFVIVTGYSNSKQKEKMLESLLTRLSKNKNLTLCYCTHHPKISEKVYDLCDYVIYNKENPILNWDITDKFTRTWGSKLTFPINGTVYDFVYPSPYHGYAHFLSLCDGISQGVNTFHDTFSFINYDVIDFCLDQLPLHIKEISKNKSDAIFYMFGKGDNRYNTEFFTFNTTAAKAFYLYRDYQKFSQFPLMIFENIMTEICKTNNLNVLHLDHGQKENTLGKVQFSEPDTLNNPRTQYFYPVYKDLVFFPVIIKDQKYVVVVNNDNDIHIHLNDKEVFTKAHPIDPPTNLKVYDHKKLMVHVILNDDRQFVYNEVSKSN